MAKRSDLTEQILNTLLSRLDSDKTTAAEKLVELHEKLVFFFESRRCNTPYECADTTIERSGRKLLEGQEVDDEHLIKFIVGVARFILKEYFDIINRAATSIEDLLPSQTPYSDPDSLSIQQEERIETERDLEYLEKCLGKLTSAKRELVLEYYKGETGVKIENRKALAEKLGITVNALRIRALRIREKVEKCLAKCSGRVKEPKTKGNFLISHIREVSKI